MGWLTSLAVMKVGLRVERIPTDSEKVVNLGWLTNLAVTRVGLMVERKQTDSETAVKLGLVDKLGRNDGWLEDGTTETDGRRDGCELGLVDKLGRR